MFLLYANEERKEIKVSKAPKDMQHVYCTNEVHHYCRNHFICTKKAPLVEKAEEIKQRWISQLEKELKKIKEIEI